MSIRLLLIDDEDDFVEILGDWLKFKGYDVATASDGIDGLEKLRTGEYDLIVLDLMMPRLDGYEFCRVIKKDDGLKNIPIVILSAITRLGASGLIKDLGVDAFVEKMADHDELAGAITSVLAARKTANDREEAYN